MGIMNLASAAARFAAAEADLEAARAPMLAAACMMVAGKSRGLIGHPNDHWAPLKPETLKRKDGVNTPLLESGKLRASIEWNADSNHGFVGSNSDVTVVQELGSSRGLPPRSFLALAAQQEGPAVAKMMSKVVGAALGGRLANGSAVGELFELAHLLGHVAHEVKETASELLESDDEEQKR
jgi:phage gpG-like protein